MIQNLDRLSRGQMLPEEADAILDTYIKEQRFAQLYDALSSMVWAMVYRRKTGPDIRIWRDKLKGISKEIGVFDADKGARVSTLAGLLSCSATLGPTKVGTGVGTSSDRIISSVRDGARSISDISKKTGMPEGNVRSFLIHLMRDGYIMDMSASEGEDYRIVKEALNEQY